MGSLLFLVLIASVLPPRRAVPLNCHTKEILLSVAFARVPWDIMGKVVKPRLLHHSWEKMGAIVQKRGAIKRKRGEESEMRFIVGL